MPEPRLAWHWAVAEKMHLSAGPVPASEPHSGWKSPWREAFTACSTRQAGASCLNIIILDTALIKSFCMEIFGLRAWSWRAGLIMVPLLHGCVRFNSFLVQSSLVPS